MRFCTFWAIVASRYLIVQGAYASNAFAEADLSKIPLYVIVGNPFRIPEGQVLPVKHALQGHPEAPQS